MVLRTRPISSTTTLSHTESNNVCSLGLCVLLWLSYTELHKISDLWGRHLHRTRRTRVQDPQVATLLTLLQCPWAEHLMLSSLRDAIFYFDPAWVGASQKRISLLGWMMPHPNASALDLQHVHLPVQAFFRQIDRAVWAPNQPPLGQEM